jgi:hypothetical protein
MKLAVVLNLVVPRYGIPYRAPDWCANLSSSLIGARPVIGRRAGAVDLTPDLSAVRIGGLRKHRRRHKAAYDKYYPSHFRTFPAALISTSVGCASSTGNTQYPVREDLMGQLVSLARAITITPAKR